MKASEYLIYKLSDQMKASTKIDADLFKQKKVKRGLRNEDGTGVLVGLTNIFPRVRDFGYCECYH